MARTLPNPRIGVFRLDLFKQSETFIASQAATFTSVDPVFVGRKLIGENSQGFRVVTLPPDRLAEARFLVLGDARGLAGACEGLSLIHAHFAQDATFAVPLARRLGVPLMATLHGFDVTVKDAERIRSAEPIQLLALLRRRALQRQASIFICVSEFIRQSALRKGYPSDKLLVNYIGVDLGRVRPVGTTEPGLVVHVGRLVEKKGTAYLIEAFSAVALACSHAKLVIIGEGPLEKDLRTDVARLNLGDRVLFKGALPHVSTLEWMAKAELVAVPSVTALNGDSEGLPTVIPEAGALAVPVVASRTSGIPEIIDDGQNGLLVPERDIGALAAAIKTILVSTETRTRLAANARDRIERHFDMYQQTRKLERLYYELSEGVERGEPR